MSNRYGWGCRFEEVTDDLVPRLHGVAVCAEAYGQARSRLPIELLQQPLAKLCSRLNGYVNDAERWLGHRVWVIDGSSCL